jgi:hypothetical protein
VSWLGRIAQSRAFWLTSIWVSAVSGLVFLWSATLWWGQEPAYLAYGNIGVGALMLLNALTTYRQIDRIVENMNAQD